LPLGFTPHGIRSLSGDNRRTVINFLYKRSNEDDKCVGIAPDLGDILDSIGLKK